MVIRGRLPQEPVLQNQNAWEAFKTAAPANAAAGGSGGDDAAPGDGPADDDNLWNEFQSREEQQKKRARPCCEPGLSCLAYQPLLPCAQMYRLALSPATAPLWLFVLCLCPLDCQHAC